MSDKEVEFTREALYSQGANVKKVYSSEKYNNLDIYQINCTYYSALGNKDQAYLLARAIQFFAPGIPQVYYVGLLAGENDIELLEETKQGRNINRHFYDLEEIEEETKRPVVQSLFKLMKFRNDYNVFNGQMTIAETEFPNMLEIKWSLGDKYAILKADLAVHDFEILYFEEGQEKKLNL